MIKVGLLFLLLATPFAAQNADPDRSDGQVWNDTLFVVPLAKKVDFVPSLTLRMGRDAGRPVDERFGAQILYKPHKYISFGPGYLYQAAQPLENRKFIEHRAQFVVFTRLPVFEKFVLANRALYEYRFRHRLPDASRIRFRAQLERPVKIKGRTVSPFIADEAWRDFTLNDWVRNRFFAGVGRRFNKRFYGEFYYLRQSDRRARPGDLHGAGTLFRVFF
jgi:hypothetical protein